MTTLKTILEILKSFPALIALFREIWTALSDLKQEMERKQRAEELKEAVRDAKENKDTRKLEDFFGSSVSDKSTDSGKQ